MESQAYINALAQALGQEFALDENGTLILSIDDVPMLIQERSKSFHLQMPLGTITPVDRLSVMRQLLGANFLLHETGGGALSYNAEADAVFLEYTLPVAQLDAEGFVAAIEDFTQMVDAWMIKLEEINSAAEASLALALDEISDEDEEEEEQVPQSAYIRI